MWCMRTAACVRVFCRRGRQRVDRAQAINIILLKAALLGFTRICLIIHGRLCARRVIEPQHMASFMRDDILDVVQYQVVWIVRFEAPLIILPVELKVRVHDFPLGRDRAAGDRDRGLLVYPLVVVPGDEVGLVIHAGFGFVGHPLDGKRKLRTCGLIPNLDGLHDGVVQRWRHLAVIVCGEALCAALADEHRHGGRWPVKRPAGLTWATDWGCCRRGLGDRVTLSAGQPALVGVRIA